MNKKSIVLVVLAFFMSVSMFAAGSYKVVSVTGKVTFEAAPETWKNVAVGQELSASTVLNTGLNSSVVLKLDGKTITIKAKQKDTVESLFVAASSSKGGLKKGVIAKADAVDSADGKREGVATASSRASEAKEDFAWEE